MREIKFRVWDKSYEMFLPVDVYDIHTRTDFGSFGIMRKDWEDYCKGEYLYYDSQILEQFTGLKDKNGTDIYEGDIVNAFASKYSIVFSDAAFYLNGGVFNHRLSRIVLSQEDFKVIGNIHQNPELL